MRTVFAFLLLAPLAFPQRVVNARAGLVYYAEGAITVDGQSIRSVHGRAPQIEDGQIAASPRGHSEILLGPGAVLWTGTGARVRFDKTTSDDVRVSLLSGSLIVEIKRTVAQNRLRVQVGDHAGEIRQTGVYRFDGEPARMRVFDGEILLAESIAKVARGQEFAEGSLRAFDRRETDEFFYWAAYRSLVLERDAGRTDRWKRKSDLNFAHSAFDIAFPSDLAAARIKSLAAGMTGLLYALEGNVGTDGTPSIAAARVPVWVGSGYQLRTRNGKAVEFFGVGTAAYLAENSAVRVLDPRAWAPAIAVERGTAMIEVTKEAPVVRVTVGGVATDLRAPGVYEFDAGAATVSVYRGESATVFPGSTVRAKDGQRVNLKAPEAVATFDRREQTPLFRWVADSSFRLFVTQAPFMTSWESDLVPMQAKHKVFGKIKDRRVKPLPRPWSASAGSAFSF